ncbi:MAG: RagB/SusD family nutrient uptake outer membrane protein [Bacteroidales bacterium]|nr:RagB/SusD family nutrient uptake outer membrane protein [Bacteroidales bacterium]
MKRKILSLLIIAVFIGACSEDYLEVKNENRYSGETFFTNATTAKEASTAIYSALLFQGMFEREFYFIFDLLGNDAEKNFPLQGSLLDLPNYTHNPNSGELNYLFNSCYKIIFRSNFVLDMLVKWAPTSEEDMALATRISGEAKFLRSLAYFWLVTCYGDVPLKAQLEDHLILQSERTPKAEIWANIETTLLEAIDELPLAQDYADADYGRASKGAAIALLGKVYLFQQKYADAVSQLSALRSDPYDYELASSIDDMFIYDLKTKETIFAVMHGEWQGWGVGNAYGMFGGQEGWGNKMTHTGRAMEYGFNDWWNVLVSDALVQAYTYEDEGGMPYIDPRAANTFYSEASLGGDTTFCDECDGGPILYDTVIKEGQVSWRKYEMYEVREKYGQPDSYINSQIIRYADVLLMLAEAYIENNQVDNALPLINEVRRRSNAFEYTTLGDQANARAIVRHERQMELAGEQSRFFDLVRWGILQETINAEKEAAVGIQPVKDYHVLLPIPQSERDANPVLDAQVNNNWN